MARKKNARSIVDGKSYQDILFEVKDQVAWITINRPRILNAFREQTLDEMTDAVKSTREDPSIVCIVFTGAGDKSFSAGGDFYAMRRLTFQNAYMWNDRMLGLAMAIRGVPIPVIASALFARFSSQDHDSVAMKAIAALRDQFGGHGVVPESASGEGEPGVTPRDPGAV